MTRDSIGTGLPAKIVIERRVKAASDAAFQRWVHDAVSAAKRTGHLEGSTVLTTGSGEYFILLRFDNPMALADWRATPEFRELLREADRTSTSAEEPMIQTGLETWFAVPGMPAALRPPAAWKIWLTTWIALIPHILILEAIIPAGWPPAAKLLITTGAAVTSLTFLVMPLVTRILYRWLYGRPRRAEATFSA